MATNALPSPGALYQQAQNYGMGQQQQLQQNYQSALGQATQSLAASGLAGTSIAPSLKMGYLNQYQMALNSLNDQLTQQRIGIGMQGNQQALQGALGFGAQNLQQQGLNQSAQNAGYNQTLQAQQQDDNSLGYNWQPSGDTANMMAGASQFSS
jgi:hypothetical protein